MRRLKDKYTALGRNTSLEALCGNKFYKNEMTITKYLNGILIKKQLELLVDRNQTRMKKLLSSLASTDSKIKNSQKRVGTVSKHNHIVWPKNLFHHLGLALTRKAKVIEE